MITVSLLVFLLIVSFIAVKYGSAKVGTLTLGRHVGRGCPQRLAEQPVHGCQRHGGGLRGDEPQRAHARHPG